MLAINSMRNETAAAASPGRRATILAGRQSRKTPGTVALPVGSIGCARHSYRIPSDAEPALTLASCASGRHAQPSRRATTHALHVIARCARAAVKPLLMLVACGVSWAAPLQPEQTVTDDAIHRAIRSQPVITESDIDQARRKYRMPSDADLGRVPVPSAPDLDALPQPATSHLIDLEALSKGYEANADRITAAQGIRSGPALMVFVSFAMPRPTLERLVDQAARTQAALLLRGLVNGSLRDTVARVQQLIGSRQVAFRIDPQAFDRFAVVQVPTFVLGRDGAQSTPCPTGRCVAPDAYVAVSGDVSLDYALEAIERRAPRFARDAQIFLNRIRG